MTDYDIESRSKLSSYFPSDTSIRDFGYPESHPLRSGDFAEVAHLYDDDDDSIQDLDDDDYPFITSPNNQQFRGIHGHQEYGDEDVDIDDAEEGNHEYNDNDFDEGRSNDEINRKARALFDFHPENDNEVALTEGQIIWISYRHGQGWLVAEDPTTAENGLVPEEYVEIFYEDDEKIVEEDVPKRFLPGLLQSFTEEDDKSDDDWVDTDYDEDEDADDDDDGEDDEEDDEVDISEQLKDVKLAS
ncbi:protein that interacts with Nap1, which is [Scheffersomyces xylosifermentans]|uniref:protein that interacts with Nap1, which is n=1 Tax=Scheffersomyces xylosifermentans TaxID=1304137 RepID=UPI00315CB446